MRRLLRHRNSLALVTLLFLAAPAGARQDARTSTSEFTILSRGQAVGSESIAVTESAGGWLITASGSLGPPFDQATSRFQLRYSPDWRPISLSLEGTQANQLIVLSTTVAGGMAHTEGMQRGERVNATQPISAQSILLPTGFYAAYEALALRLAASATVGTVFRLHVPAIGEINGRVLRVTPHRLTSPAGPIELRAFDMKLDSTGAPIDLEVWVDARGRLARLAIPASWFVMIREDISSVMTREETVKRPGDEEVFIPSVGFGLAATISKPSGAAGKLPAVVLVGGSDRLDRDERIGGAPVFANLAAALSDAGFIVARYDKRGVGRSAGRTESATLDDYAEDAMNVAQWLRKRPEVDSKRIAIIGYGEGGAMALLAGTRDKRVAALCLVGSTGLTGRETVLRQQQRELARSGEPDDVKQAKVALQTRIVDAVIKGGSWEGIAPELRRQAETPWFKTWLLFDPAKVMPKVKQPLLIVDGALDVQFPPSDADRLETLARARKKLPQNAAQKVIVPGVNHQLVAASSGDESEYEKLAGAPLSTAVSSAIVDWLKITFARKN